MEKRYHKFTEQLVFAIVMRDEEVCKELIERIIPNRKIKAIRFAENEMMDALAKAIADRKQGDEPGEIGFSEISEIIEKKAARVDTEKQIFPAMLSKSVRFDALFEDDSIWVDIEMQVESEADLPLRIRYYHASKDVESLHSGDDYRKLKPGYVIFLCLFDHCGKGEAVYHFQTMEEKFHLPLNDNQFTIIANLKCPEEKIPEELKSFYQYVNHGNAGDDAFTQRLKELVDRANADTEVRNMITFAGDVAAKEKQLKEALAQAEARIKEEIAKAEAEKAQAEAEKARAEAAERLNELALLLAERNRMDEYIKAAADPAYQHQLFEEFGL